MKENKDNISSAGLFNNQNEPKNQKKKKKIPKYKTLNTKNWGINFNKNEYYEIVLSNSNHPEKL